MSEALLESLLVLHFLYELAHFAHIPDLQEHLEHVFVGTAVEGALKGSSAACDAGKYVDSTGSQVAHCGGRAVQLVFRVQDEQHVQDTCKSCVHFAPSVASLVDQVQEDLGITLFGMLLLVADDLEIVPAPAHVCCNQHRLPQDALDLFQLVLLVLVRVLDERRVGVGVDSTEDSETCDHLTHGVGVGLETPEYVLH